jgi:glycosyltransferase involved in cell wall biosynthesis
MNGLERHKVLQIFKYYAPNVGGVEKVAQDIAEGLRGRIESRVLACHEALQSKRDAVNGIEVVRAGRIVTRFSVPLAPRFPLFLKQMAAGSDILHYHLPFPLSDVSHLLVHPHGRLVVWWHSEIVRPKNLAKLYRPFLKRFLRKVDRIIVAAPQLVDKSPFLRQFKEKCRLIPIGIDIERFQPTQRTDERIAEIRRRYKGPIILFVGRLIYYKGVECLIQAMARLRGIDATLLVVGEGPLKGQLETLAAEKGVLDRIVFHGKATDDELLDYYHACDLFVLPSIANTEAYGIVQLEAMACGKPVISTDLPTGVPFVNQHMKTGIIVPPGDSDALGKAMERLLDDRGLAAQYGEAGRRRVEREFTVDVMLKRVLALYDEVMAS